MMVSLNLAQAWRNTKKTRARLRRRRKAEASELVGLVSLTEEKQSKWKDLSNTMNEIVYRHTGILMHKIGRGAFLLSKYSDQHGDVPNLFRRHCIDKADQLNWLEFWSSLDYNDDNKMEYKELVDGFRLTDDLYVKRFFDMINISLTGYVSFHEFIATCWDFLIKDREKTLQLAFRLLSRVGNVFDPARSILDIGDLKVFLEFRYPDLAGGLSIQKRAKALFHHIDKSGSNCIDYPTFRQFCLEENSILLINSVRIQTQMRRRLFGDKFWQKLTVERSQLYAFDKVLDGSIRHLLKSDDGIKPDFNHDFPKISKAFRDDKTMKEQALKDKMNSSLKLAEHTRDKIVQFLEDLEGDRWFLRKAFKRWKYVNAAVKNLETEANLARQAAADKLLIEEAAKKKMEAGKEASSKSSIIGLLNFGGWGKKGKKSISSTNEPSIVIKEKNANQTGSSAGKPNSIAVIIESGGEEDNDGISSLEGTSRIFFPSKDTVAAASEVEISVLWESIHKKILAREARAVISTKDLYEMMRGDYMNQVHKARPLPKLEDVDFCKQLLLLGGDQGEERKECDYI